MAKIPSSPVGGGVVSAELLPSRSSEIPEAVGEVEERSDSPVGWWWSTDDAGVSGFIFTRTDAASRSWTC